MALYDIINVWGIINVCGLLLSAFLPGTFAVELDDVEIMRRVQAGQVELFDELVRRYRGPLLHVAWSKLGDRAWAEDTMQETLLAAFTARATYNPRFAFRTWVWTILLNLCRRQWRRRESRPRERSLSNLPPDELAGFHEPVTHDTALAQLVGTERREQVHRLLARLPEAQADALRLRFFGGLQFSEIALAMGSSVSGAKQRVKHGLIELAEQLRDRGGDFL
jgi:RNA polymerase sigma-70 factor (ECF subfamily)